MFKSVHFARGNLNNICGSIFTNKTFEFKSKLTCHFKLCNTTRGQKQKSKYAIPELNTYTKALKNGIKHAYQLSSSDEEDGKSLESRRDDI